MSEASASRAINRLTIGYIVIIAALMAYSSEGGWKIIGIMFGETAFALPMVIAGQMFSWFKRERARRLILLFIVAFPIFSAIEFYMTFAGSRDAQYQLVLLLIPMIGFPAILATGIVAAFLDRDGD